MLLFSLLFLLVSSKYVSTVLIITPDDPWKYVSKFASTQGKGHWEMKAMLMNPTNTREDEFFNVTGTIYIDKKWEDALAQATCSQKVGISKNNITLEVPLNGDWSDSIMGTMVQRSRTHFWYFTISACEIKEKQRIKIEMKFLNADESEFSAEDLGLQYVYPIILVIYFFALSGNLLRLIRKFNQTDDLELNLLVLNISIGCQYTAILCEVIHVWAYAYNGYGVVFLDVFYQAFEVLSSIIITILLIVIASGWTLKYKDFPDAEIYLPISLFVIVLNLMIVGVGRLTEDFYYKNSDYEGIPGYVLVFIRIALWIWFVYLIKDMQEQQKRNAKLLDFLNKYFIMASLYFLALPAVVVFSWIFEPYVRNKAVVVLNNFIQILVFLFLTHLFSEKSTFYKVSTLSDSVLPRKNQ